MLAQGGAWDHDDSALSSLCIVVDSIMVSFEAQSSAWDGGRTCRGKHSGSSPQDTDDLQIVQDDTSVDFPSQLDQELETG